MTSPLPLDYLSEVEVDHYIRTMAWEGMPDEQYDDRAVAIRGFAAYLRAKLSEPVVSVRANSEWLCIDCAKKFSTEEEAREHYKLFSHWSARVKVANG